MPFIILGLVLLSISPLQAQSRASENTLTRDAGAPVPTADLADLAWLAGHWRGEGLGGAVEEIWSPAEGGSMMGMFRLIQEDRVVFYELMTIAPAGGSLALNVKHFHPDLTGWEERTEVRSFPLVRMTPAAAFFDRLTLRRSGADAMEAFVIVRGSDGSTREESFRYRRSR